MTDSTKLAIKVALSIALTMVLPLAFGWDKPYWAAVAVLVMATTESYSQGVTKGRHRLAGSLIGISIAFVLLATLSQERELFLLAYLALAGVCAFGAQDPNYGYIYKMAFTVCAVICFTGGLNSSGSFNIAVLRLEENLLGILAYSLVFSLLWPEKNQPQPMKPVCCQPTSARLGYSGRVVLILAVCIVVWIGLPIPGGFIFPMLASSLVLILVEQPSSAIRQVAIVISLWALVILVQFIWLLPRLTEAWQLGLFYFINTFLVWKVFPRPEQMVNRMLGSQMLLLLTNGAAQLVPSYNMITPLSMLLYMFVCLALIYTCMRLTEPQPVLTSTPVH